jgi:hypothetical protein
LNEMELYKATGSTTYLTNVYNHLSGVSLGACGLYFYDGSGSLEYSASEAFLAALYHSVNQNATIYTIVKTSVNAMLGSHTAMTGAPANFSFIIGYNQLGGGFPKHPQHGPAWGQTNSGNIWTLYSSETSTPGSVPFKYECTGALVGGPKAKCNTYVDNIDDSDANEVCVGYNAQFIGAVAYVNKVENNITTLTKEIYANENIKLYPNPAEEELVISIEGQTQLFILNQLGEEVASVYVDKMRSINVSALSDGLYYVVNSDKTVALKFIKK